MSKEMVISANPHETRVAILEEGQLCEYYVEREKEFALVGSIYKGRVTRVLPGMQSAFVEIGLDSDAFLYVTDFLEGIEEFDEHVATTAEEKIQKMEEQGGQVFPASAAAPALEPADVEAAPAPFAAPTEEFASDRAIPSAPIAPPPPPPVLNTSSPDRPQFENRSPRPDRGGRDFGRRGGRRGGRFGRRDNRGGRGGGGGDRRYGRELPPSKYASPRPYEDQSSEPALPSDYVPIILPGESLAKYKEKPPSAAPPPSVEENVSTTEAQVAAPEPAAAIQEPPASSFSAPVVEAPRSPRSEYRPSSSGLEPLPGESLAKWRHAEPAASPSAETVAAPEVTEEIALSREERNEREREFESQERMYGAASGFTETSAEIEAAHEAAPDLTDEEAAALAEHVADAQSDEIERAAEDRVFASPEEIAAAEAADAEEAEAASEEEQALEKEEEVAETEGMIAPPENGGETEIGEHREEMTAEETLAANSESASGENNSPAAAEGNAPQGQPWKASMRSNDFRARMQHPGRRGGRDRDRGRG
ncbi:MAG: hypothetical protein WB460_08215, partial [Candidatus Acidiferrales bacterium]